MAVTGIISALIVGLVIGVLGRLLAPGKQNIPMWLTIVVGIVAALAGTAIARGVGYADTDGIDWLEVLTQLVLAVLGVSLASTLRGGRRRKLMH
ncbi:transglycosylase [Amycolatopsis deserti]|uniref:Transglycosylase n=1 Tax=Amycolatopsis deserti TaxID=185696 RepID=A0ABQ3IET3_9PSEU|nr:GlsB/YeaQ/YmgE family stress response membrane protein [Amycolatopsis deserti]GHE78294.1 transglycosylase [Amycolatopsis deserti]